VKSIAPLLLSLAGGPPDPPLAGGPAHGKGFPLFTDELRLAQSLSDLGKTRLLSSPGEKPKEAHLYVAPVPQQFQIWRVHKDVTFV